MVRSPGPHSGAILAVVHAERNIVDEAAREAIAAAALLATQNEAVHLIVIGTANEDWTLLGADFIEILPNTQYTLAKLLGHLGERYKNLKPRHILIPDRGADATLGRAFIAASKLDAAARVVEINNHEVRVRVGDAQDACAPLPIIMLLERGVALSPLPFDGLGHLKLTSLIESPDCSSPQNDWSEWGEGITVVQTIAGDAATEALTEADFIVAAGDGVIDTAMFERLASCLGGAIGASRVAVDNGSFARERQIGASGKTVSARGYLAIGISGATQHLQGIQACRHVIAINTDPSAPITQRAELTVVADAQLLMAALVNLVEQQQLAQSS